MIDEMMMMKMMVISCDNHFLVKAFLAATNRMFNKYLSFLIQVMGKFPKYIVLISKGRTTSK